MEALNLNIDKDNDIRFAVNVEGAEGDPVSYRLVIEGGRMALNFPGYITDENEVQIIVPTLAKTLREGTYDARLEVMVGDRVFSPLSSKAHLKESVKIVAAPITPPPAPKTTVAVAGVRIADPHRAAFAERRVEQQREQRIMETREKEARDASFRPMDPPVKVSPQREPEEDGSDIVALERFRRALGSRR
jgi:hypothetical protein